MDNIYNKYKKELNEYVEKSKHYAETSKQWAAAPLNSPLENGLYSSRHYALLLQNKENQNG